MDSRDALHGGRLQISEQPLPELLPDPLSFGSHDRCRNSPLKPTVWSLLDCLKPSMIINFPNKIQDYGWIADAHFT